MQQYGNRIPSNKKQIVLTNNTTAAEIKESTP